MWVVIVVVVIQLGCLVRALRANRPLVETLGMAANRSYARLWHGLRSNRLPIDKGGVLLVCNHTSSTDASFVTAAAHRPFSFLVAAEYAKIRALRPLIAYLACVPVSRNGRDVAAIRGSMDRLKQGRAVCIFPEGGLSNAGRRAPRRGKCGAAYLALASCLENDIPVIPVLIQGGPRTSDIMKAWLRPSRVRVTFGSPIKFSAYAQSRRDRWALERVTETLRQQIIALDSKVK
jgi:1-acyl-sn-glycerol-3-phosphate acyltransferase